MNRSSIQYRAYKALLESNLTSRERESLLEAGILQKVADFFGATGETAKMMTGGVKKIFADAKLGRRSATAKKNIEKELNDLKAIAKDAGQDDSVVYNILNMILSDSGMKPDQVAAPPAASSGGNTSTGSESETKPGAPVDPGQPESAVPTIAAAAAQAAGQDPAKAKEQAAEKKVDLPKATQVLAKAVSSIAKVDAAKTQQIVDFLIKNKHMVAEGRRVMTPDVVNAAREAITRVRSTIMLERWSSLAGVLTEADPKDSGGGDDEVPKEAQQWSKLIDQIVGRLKGVKKKEIAAVLKSLDDLGSIQIKA
jgi:hypothetical protein